MWKNNLPRRSGTLITKEESEKVAENMAEKIIRTAINQLGSAAKRDIGNGPNQIPDMSYYIYHKSPTSIAEQLPDGIIRMAGEALVTSDDRGRISIKLPSSFPNSVAFQCAEMNSSEYGGREQPPFVLTPFRTDGGTSVISFAVKKTTTGEVMKNDQISIKYFAIGY